MTTQAASNSLIAPRAHKILVAVAFEPTADVALFEGMNLAARRGASELHVVHAVADVVGLSVDAVPLAGDRMAEASAELRRRIETAWQQNGEIEVIAHLRPGDPAHVIVQASIDISADLIVVGSHRRTGLRRLVLGSVAERVLHAAHCPVLVAVPKDYGSTNESLQVEPPCDDCLQTRRATANASFWCERHNKPYLEPHIYVPRESQRSSLLSTY